MSPSEKKSSRATRLGVALPGALAGALFLGVAAFGANAPHTADQADAAPTAKAVHLRATEPDPTPPVVAKVRVEPVEEPVEDPKLFPRTPKAPSEQPPKPKPAETVKPKPAPAPSDTIALEGWSKGAKAKLAWKAFGGTGFEYYKVVRSADGTVSWPAGANDVVIAAIGDPHATWWADAPTCGTPWSYAVFAVRHGDAGYVTLAVSNVVTITTTCAPEPKPGIGCGMGLEVHAKAGIGIKLAWEACHAEGFAAYKVVRSQTNADPRYPLNEGTELVAVLGDASSTFFLDEAVAAGETWTYRVVAVTDGGGTLIVAGESAALSATAQ